MFINDYERRRRVAPARRRRVAPANLLGNVILRGIAFTDIYLCLFMAHRRLPTFINDSFPTDRQLCCPPHKREGERVKTQ